MIRKKKMIIKRKIIVNINELKHLFFKFYHCKLLKMKEKTNKNESKEKDENKNKTNNKSSEFNIDDILKKILESRK